MYNGVKAMIDAEKKLAAAAGVKPAESAPAQVEEEKTVERNHAADKFTMTLLVILVLLVAYLMLKKRN